MRYAYPANCCYQLEAYVGSNGIGEEFKTIARMLEEIIDEDRQSAIKGKRHYLYESLWEIYKECTSGNWDGYNAKPITLEAWLEAFSLIPLLPISLPLPEVIPEPTGEVVFEWYRDKHHVFVISVGGTNIIAYTGLFGKTSKTRGTEYYSDSLPSIIIANIQRLFEWPEQS
jgi:hypothetical protein